MLQWINCIQTIPSIRTNKVTHWNFEFNMLTRFAVNSCVEDFKFYKTFDNNWIWTQCISMHFVTVRQYDISMCTSQVVVLLFNASHQQRDTCCSWRSLCFVNPFTDSALFFLKCITLSWISFELKRIYIQHALNQMVETWNLEHTQKITWLSCDFFINIISEC